MAHQCLLVNIPGTDSDISDGDFYNLNSDPDYYEEEENSIEEEEDISNAESGGSAIILFVDLRTIRIKERVTVGIGFLDICGAEGIAGEGFDIEAGAGSVEGMAVAYEEGYENEVGLIRSEIIEAYFSADLVAFADGEAAVEKGAEAGGWLSF